MEFKEVTDALKRPITQAEIAEKLGVSHASIRQARLSEDAASYRSPPPGWEVAIARLARERAEQLLALADSLHPDAATSAVTRRR